MTEKQLGNSVVHGRKISFTIAGDYVITGYLGGLDDDSFLVLVVRDDRVCPHLVSRRDTLFQQLHSASTLSEEPHMELLEAVLVPFRKWVRETLLGKDAPKSR